MRKIITVFLILTLFITAANAESYALIETATGQIMKSSGENETVKSGVLAKLMTALLTAEKLENGELTLDKLVSVSQSVSKAKAPIVWLEAGERITVRELLKGLLTGNANDCAVALACVNSQSVSSFVKCMNEKAKALGMKATRFNDCMNDCDTTACDMAVLSAEITRHECLKEYMITFMDYIKDGKTMLVNNNKLIKNYNGISGQIAGRTDDSGWCIALSAKREDKEYACVLLGEEDEESMFSKAKGLLDSGFNNYITFTPNIEPDSLEPIRVKKGVSKLVGVKVSGIQSVIIEKGEEESIDYEIVKEQILKAPVDENQVVGKLNIKKNGEIILSADIVTTQKVERMTAFKYFVLFVKSFFK